MNKISPLKNEFYKIHKEAKKINKAILRKCDKYKITLKKMKDLDIIMTKEKLIERINAIDNDKKANKGGNTNV